jgi:hypothetical protein
MCAVEGAGAGGEAVDGEQEQLVWVRDSPAESRTQNEGESARTWLLLTVRSTKLRALVELELRAMLPRQSASCGWGLESVPAPVAARRRRQWQRRWQRTVAARAAVAVLAGPCSTAANLVRNHSILGGQPPPAAAALSILIAAQRTQCLSCPGAWLDSNVARAASVRARRAVGSVRRWTR